MKRALEFGILLAVSLASTLHFAHAASANQVAYIRGSSPPWGQISNETAMDRAFGTEGWDDLRLSEGAGPFTISGNGDYAVIFIDGSDGTATEFSGFLAAHGAAINNWVNAGGALILNSAPNVGTSFSMGFGVTLNYPQFGPNVVASNPAHPIFAGPFLPTATAMTGNSYAHATVSGTGLTPIIDRSPEADQVLAEKSEGAGHVIFGGMTTHNFHSPGTEAANLRANLLVHACRSSAMLSDDDGDTFPNACDNCPNDANPMQEDSDGDFSGDVCDNCVGPGPDDADGDGICTLADNCPAVANPPQEDTDSDGIGDACNDAEDSDGDEWADSLDNCPDDANPGQQNTCAASPGGDACDVDSDADGIFDDCDNCPSLANPGQEDVNGDQQGDTCQAQGQLDNAGCYAAFDTVAAPDGNEPTYSFIDISGTGTPSGLTSHSVTGAIPIGFTFEYYGVTYSSLHISANGFLSLLAAQGEGCCGSQSLPQSGIPDAVIAGLWSHIHIPSGAVYYQTLGTSPTRQFVVQFQGVSNVSTGTPDTWEIILHEGSNDILVQYASANGSAFEGRAGIEDEDGTIGLQWAGPAPIALVNHAVLYSPTSEMNDDADSDGLRNCLDNCPAVSNPGQEDTCAATAAGDACDSDTDGDSVADACDNCPMLANPGQEDTDNSGIGDACNDALDADGDEFEDDIDNCPDDPNPGIGNAGAGALSQLLAGLNSNNAALSALVPNRFDFSEGATGTMIGDGGNDMYDGGNVLNTNLATAIPYTNGVITASDARFGAGSSYFTAKYTGVFVMAATDLSINRFEITGNNGADGGGSVDGAVLSTNSGGLQYTIFVKRVFNAFDPSINHIVIVPGSGVGVTHSFPASTDNDLHTIDGLNSSHSLFYILVARQNGMRLDDADVISIANEFLSNFGQADADGDGFGDACDTCVGAGAGDGDGDGVCDLADNCPVDPNPGQEDGDADDIGDACECGDGNVSIAETCDDGNDDSGDGCSAECQIEAGYECVSPGNPCSDIDECALATDNCDANAACTNAPGSFSCACNGGFQGTGVLCTDIDECALASDDCDVNATCTNTAGSFSCACNPGFVGDGVVCDLTHLVGYKLRLPRTDVGGTPVVNTLPRGWVITVNDILLDDSAPDDPENFEVKKAKSLLNPAQKNLEAMPDLDGLHYLHYQLKTGKESIAPPVEDEFLKPPKHVERVWQLHNQFGTINVQSKKVSGLLLPANKDLDSSPLPPGDANHFVCYQVKATADVTAQTPETSPGSGVGRFRKDLQAFFEDQFDDCALDEDGGASFSGSPAAGKCLFDLTKVKQLCNPINKTAVVPPRETSATITPSLATVPRSLLCYQAKLAGKFISTAAAALADAAVGDAIAPGQAKHTKRGVKTGNPVHTVPGNQFTAPVLVDTSNHELVCIPTSVTSVAPVTP
jgi:hypothetical protein